MRASPIPVFPAVASTMVPPGASLPSCSALRMIPMAARSFTLPPGFKYSSLAKMSAELAGTSRFKRRRGVPPTKSVMSSATPRCEISELFRCTLQGKGRVRNRQWNQSQLSKFKVKRLFRPRGGRLCSRIISTLSAHHHLAVSFRLGLHANRAEASARPWISWPVSNGVLIADVARYLPADLVYPVESGGEKG